HTRSKRDWSSDVCSSDLPHQDTKTIQGALELMYDLQVSLEEITGMHEITLQPAAGSQGEWTSLMIFKAFHEANGEGHRNEIIVRSEERRVGKEYRYSRTE